MSNDKYVYVVQDPQAAIVIATTTLDKAKYEAGEDTRWVEINELQWFGDGHTITKVRVVR